MEGNDRRNINNGRNGRSRNRRNNAGGNGSKTILYAVMAVFCILALAEIIYGNFKSRAGYEAENIAGSDELLSVQETENGEGVSDDSQLPDIPLQGMFEESLEDINEAIDESENEAEAKNEAVKENADGSGKSAPGGETAQNEQSGDKNQSENSGDNAKPEKTADMQIVFMGDSILDGVREYDGVAYLISQACNADVYNMAIGGTTAALMTGESYAYNDWTSCSLLGVVHAILGNIDPKILEPYRAGELLKECDFSKTDYFVIEYGVNDFLAKIPDSQYTNDGELRNIDKEHTYVGALETAIGLLHDAFPSAKILLIAPHYCQFFSGDAYIGDSYSLDYGYGPMIDYSELCGYVYNHNKDKNLLYFNTIMDSGIDAYSADDCLEDGIHLSAKGRKIYAEKAASIINNDFRKNE